MSKRLVSALVLSLAMAAGPMGAGFAAAQEPTEVVVPGAALSRSSVAFASNSLRAKLMAETRKIQNYDTLTSGQKLAALQKITQDFLTSTGASARGMQQILQMALERGFISPAVAIATARSVSPEVGAAVATNLGFANATATTSTGNNGAVSVLVSLQNVTNTATIEARTANQPYDPCAGVIAAYCGG